jgi:hypothetical protein
MLLRALLEAADSVPIDEWDRPLKASPTGPTPRGNNHREFVDCPHCYAGSGKAKGHVGRHSEKAQLAYVKARTASKRGTLTLRELASGSPVPPLNGLKECPSCTPGSGKPKGHLGRHFTRGLDERKPVVNSDPTGEARLSIAPSPPLSPKVASPIKNTGHERLAYNTMSPSEVGWLPYEEVAGTCKRPNDQISLSSGGNGRASASAANRSCPNDRISELCPHDGCSYTGCDLETTAQGTHAPPRLLEKHDDSEEHLAAYLDEQRRSLFVSNHAGGAEDCVGAQTSNSRERELEASPPPAPEGPVHSGSLKRPRPASPPLARASVETHRNLQHEKRHRSPTPEQCVGGVTAELAASDTETSVGGAGVVPTVASPRMRDENEPQSDENEPQSDSSSEAEEASFEKEHSRPSAVESMHASLVKEACDAARETVAETDSEASTVSLSATSATSRRAVEPQAAAAAAALRPHTTAHSRVLPPHQPQNESALSALQEWPLAVQAVMGGARLNDTPAVGWHRACVAGSHGGAVDVHYFAPDGTQLRSTNDVRRWIESQPELAAVEMAQGPKASACSFFSCVCPCSCVCLFVSVRVSVCVRQRARSVCARACV